MSKRLDDILGRLKEALRNHAGAGDDDLADLQFAMAACRGMNIGSYEEICRWAVTGINGRAER